MFIAHMPAGYLLTKKILQVVGCSSESKQYCRYMVLGLVASIAPDLDLLYFYFIDNRQHIHHSYWSHIPIYWCVLLLATAIVSRIRSKPIYFVVGLIVCGNALLHTILDTVVGGIMWLYPLQQEYLAFFTVQPRYKWWIWNFLIHWTFVFELMIMVWAGRAFVRSWRARTTVVV